MSNQASDSTRRLIAAMFVVVVTSTAGFAQTSAERTLFVYGPGGPLSPMQEAAARFGKAHGVKVVVTGGPEVKWVGKAQQDGDVVYGGAEYMLSQLAMKHPTLVDRATREGLYVRPSGILVRKAIQSGSARSRTSLSRAFISSTYRVPGNSGCGKTWLARHD